MKTVGLFAVPTVILLALKLTVLTGMSWWVVATPMIILLVLAVIGAIMVGGFLLISASFIESLIGQSGESMRANKKAAQERL